MPRRTSLVSGDPSAALSARLRGGLRDIPDFPRVGVLFRDISPLLADPELFGQTVLTMASACRRWDAETIAGIESRGFILGGAIAHEMGAGFVPLRKQGRLPGATLSAAYSLEYGEATLEVHTDSVRDGQRVLIVDDLLATGGTAGAAIRLVEGLGGVVAGLAFLVELIELNGAVALEGHDYISLIAI